MAGQARWAVVTGAAGGIGAAVARHLAKDGFAIMMQDLQPEALEAAADRVRALGGTAETMAGDAADPDHARSVVEHAETLGRVDALVNVAGGSGPKVVRTIEEMDDAAWNHVMALNVTSAFLFCRSAVPAMRARGYGRIVNLSSTAARGRKGPVTTQGARLAYGTAKAALLGFTAQLAKDEAKNGITVNALMPGLILSEQGTRIRARFEALPEEQRQRMLSEIPAGRAGEADEVAAVAAFLCSPAAGYVNGVGLPVEGAFL